MVATDLEYSPDSLLFRASSAVSLYAYVPIVSAVGGGIATLHRKWGTISILVAVAPHKGRLLVGVG